MEKKNYWHNLKILKNFKITKLKVYQRLPDQQKLQLSTHRKCKVLKIKQWEKQNQVQKLIQLNMLNNGKIANNREKMEVISFIEIQRVKRTHGEDHKVKMPRLITLYRMVL